MTTKTHWIGQILATLLQILNMASGLVPAKYQAYVAFGLTVVQAGMGLYNHYYNPDGTPAAVAYVAKLLLLFLLLSVPAMAQTSAPQTQTFNVSIGASALGLTSSKQADTGTDIVINFNLKGKLDLRSDNILSPGPGLQFYGGGFQYPFLDKQLAKTNLKGLQPYVTGSVGVDRIVPATPTPAPQSHIGFLVGGGLNYKNSSGIVVNLVEVRYADFPGYGRKPVVSGGLSYVFGSH